MAKIGKVNTKKVKDDIESRKWKSFATYFKPKVGTNFIRMLPPVEGQDMPWLPQKKHFSLTESQKGISNCTYEPKTCYICKQVSKDLNASKKNVRALADKRKAKLAYAFQMIDVTPLYTKEGKNKFVADNPPPKCWGQVKIDDEGDFIGKCRKCEWNEACARGIQIGALSGQRIDDITDLREGRNILIKRTGEGLGTTYSISCDEDYAWSIPKNIRKFIKENFIDLCDIVKPATPEETEEAWHGTTTDVDMPPCYGEYDEGKKKCKKCEYSDLCEDEKIVESEDNNNNDNDDGKKKRKKKKDKKKPTKKTKEENNDDNDNNNNDNNDNDNDDENNNDDEDVLKTMNKKELKQFIKDNDLDIKIKKEMSEDDIRKAIKKELEEKDDDNNNNNNDNNNDDDNDNNNDDDNDNNNDDDNDDEDKNKKKGNALKEKLKKKASEKKGKRK